jgi:hypothetical protein
VGAVKRPLLEISTLDEVRRLQLHWRK